MVRRRRTLAAEAAVFFKYGSKADKVPLKERIK